MQNITEFWYTDGKSDYIIKKWTQYCICIEWITSEINVNVLLRLGDGTLLIPQPFHHAASQ